MEIESFESYFSDATSSEVGSIFSDASESDSEYEKPENEIEDIEIGQDTGIDAQDIGLNDQINAKIEIEVQNSLNGSAASSMISLSPPTASLQTKSRYV